MSSYLRSALGSSHSSGMLGGVPVAQGSGLPGAAGEAAAPGGKTAAAIDLGSARVLVADGDVMSQRVIASVLQQAGYDTVIESQAEAVLPALEKHAIDVVLLDMGLGGANGEELMRRIHRDKRYRDLPIVIVSSPTHHDAAIATLSEGADDVVMKPVDPYVLLARIKAALRMRRAMLGMEAAHQVIATLAQEMNARDADMQSHTERIGRWASELGHRVGLSSADMQAVAYSILLHDLGRIGISESIMLKRGPLSDDELDVVRRHVEVGERIAASLPGAERFGPIIRHHHERWDGQGYPDGLEGHKIPSGARIIGIVDAFDAMTQFRPYREPLSIREAVEELRKERGRQFDSAFVDEFVGVIEWDGLT
ncbi:MAG: HD domain-containing phosphohydrolase [Candidatus Limnocylindrales bacterium]